MDIQRVCCEYFRQWKFGSLGTLHTVETRIPGDTAHSGNSDPRDTENSSFCPKFTRTS